MLTILKSASSVQDTVGKITALIEEKELILISSIDHAAAASYAELELKPTTVLVFGNPKMGTRLLQQNQQIGIDLPLKILVWEDESGQVQIGYKDIIGILAEHNMQVPDELSAKSRDLMKGIVEEAAK